MVTNKLLSRNEETVEVLDFRKQEIVDIFKDLPVDQALLKLKENNAEDDIDNYNEENLGQTDQLSSELSKLNNLHKSGALNKEEFEKAKKKILDN